MKRELGLRDVVFFTISGILGTRWLSASAHAGPGAVTLWFLAAVLFLVPCAWAMAVLSRKYPQQGGLYVWTRNDFGDWHGFLCFWLYWTSISLWFPNAVMAYSSMAVYALGPDYQHLASDRAYVVIASLLLIWVSLGSHLVGLKYGKWTQALGFVGSYGVGAMLLLIAGAVWMRDGQPATPMHFVPEFNFETINFWAQISYALTGLEMAPIIGEEIHDPERVLPKSAWIATFACAGYYSLATAALLVLMRPEQVNVLYGLAEGGHLAGIKLDLHWLGPVFAICILMGALGQFGALGSSAARLPYVVGADKYFPAAFAKLHPRWGTPHVSILTLAGIASVALVLVQFGESIRAAYSLLVDLMVLTTFVPFLYIFLSSWKAGNRVSAVSGIAVSILAMACSLVPPADTPNVLLFEVKLIGGALLLTAAARWMFTSRS
ncbi:putative transporter [Bryobacterales bacterium F-183]|nr:putative transporter [Bryobacterales bacterium F-183]